ncbi:MAG: glycosyltransferase, partial [Dysgonamonadaceae bacterium]|nr:glycosyltransferase [Dysgonamonadaceae bacterium]
RSIADDYRKRYGIDMQVVRNIPFAAQKSKKRADPVILENYGKKVLLYQGAVNLGRGIEWVIDAMPYLDDFVFYIVGDGDRLEALRAQVEHLQLGDRVFFTGRVPFEDLAAYTAQADIGINLLENRGLNYYYSLPNRIFDFIRAGIPVLSCDFPEIRNIVAHYGTGALVDRFEPEYLAGKIRELASNPIDYKAFEIANAELTWENEAETLLKVIESAR